MIWEVNDFIWLSTGVPINPETSELVLLRPKNAKNVKATEFGVPIRPLKEKIRGGL